MITFSTFCVSNTPAKNSTNAKAKTCKPDKIIAKKRKADEF